jgi:hypothetical protein
MTFTQIQDRVVAFPEYVCFVPDERLVPLVHHLPAPEVELAGGELLFRWWLYRGGCPESIARGLPLLPSELVHFIKEKVLPARENAGEEGVLAERRNALLDAGRKPCGAEVFFSKRVKTFRRAAGVIPVVGADRKHAFPIPFELQRDLHSERTVTDARGNGIQAWEEGVRPIWGTVGKHRVHIPMDLGHPGKDLQLAGGSLALPVGIAVRCHCESGHDPLLVLATGAVVDGRLSAVAGCEVKEALAQKMGARFWFAPGHGEEDGGGSATRRVHLPGDPLGSVLENVCARLEAEGLARLDVPGALRLLSRLRSHAATGRHPVEWLIRQAEKCLRVFREDNHPTLQCDAIPETQILLAALENHAGRAHRAEDILKAVGDAMANDRRIGLKLLPYRVVSLSDMGRFDDAEMWGRKALQWALTLPENREGLEARIQASGSLGGDALLQKALRQKRKDLSEESLRLLEQNRDWAIRLSSYCSPTDHRDDRNWAAMSASRVVLWHALFQPENIVERLAEAEDHIRRALGRSPPLDSSLDYLRRTAWLADFRVILKGCDAPDCARTLPSDDAPCWVKATALKYRAAIQAARHNFDSAYRDFAAAHGLLRLDRTPVIQLIGWSIAAQAVVSLPEQYAGDFHNRLREDRQYVVDYLDGFGPSRGLARIFSQGQWQADHLREFQLGFAY